MLWVENAAVVDDRSEEADEDMASSCGPPDARAL